MDELKLVEASDPILHTPALAAPAGSLETRALINKMFAKLTEWDGIGLAAPQVGVPLQVVVIQIPAAHVKFAMVNPTIKKLSGEYVGSAERCLSLPGVTAMRMRRETVDVVFWDEFGKVKHVLVGGLLSTVIQHEVDHLRGRLMIDDTVHYAEGSDEQKPAAQPVGTDDRGAVGEVGQKDVAPELPKPDEAAGA